MIKDSAFQWLWNKLPRQLRFRLGELKSRHLVVTLYCHKCLAPTNVIYPDDAPLPYCWACKTQLPLNLYDMDQEELALKEERDAQGDT